MVCKTTEIFQEAALSTLEEERSFELEEYGTGEEVDAEFAEAEDNTDDEQALYEQLERECELEEEKERKMREEEEAALLEQQEKMAKKEKVNFILYLSDFFALHIFRFIFINLYLLNSCKKSFSKIL